MNERATPESTDGFENVEEALLRVIHHRRPALALQVPDLSELARSVGERLGLGAEELEVLERAAALHDLGKVSIPDVVLSQTGPLDDEGWAFVRQHTLIAEDIISVAPELAEVARIVRSTHERWDGDGYPDRLEGEEIPLAARIIFACDGFYAMTHGRPYRDVANMREALAELRDSAGSQFDPAVVEALCEAVEVGGPPAED